MEQSRVYRPRRARAWFVFGWLAGTLSFVLVSLWYEYQEIAWFCCPLFAALLALAGAELLCARVEIGPRGVVQRGVLTGFTIAWADVASWSVVDLKRDDEHDVFDARAVRLVSGGRRPEVRESDVYRPGFEQFLADMRAWARDREAAEPGLEGGSRAQL